MTNLVLGLNQSYWAELEQVRPELENHIATFTLWKLDGDYKITRYKDYISVNVLITPQNNFNLKAMISIISNYYKKHKYGKYTPQ